jgi:pilus assembly protein Flp/PilA
LETIKAFLKDETAASAVEYVLLVAFIALVIFGGVSLLGTTLSGIYNNGATAVSGGS